MLNREKIRMMCALSRFEKTRGEEEIRVLEYYKFDYLMRNIAFSFIRYTLCFLLCVAVYIGFNTSSLFYSINLSGITGLIGKLVIIYFIGLIAYLAITWAVYSVRYNRADEDIEEFASGLRKFDRRFNGRSRRGK